jgi:hypothetical protein
MSTTKPVDLGGVYVRGTWAVPTGPEPRVELTVYTESGQARIARLEERDVLALMDQCVDVLKKLRIRRAAVEAARKEESDD